MKKRILGWIAVLTLGFLVGGTMLADWPDEIIFVNNPGGTLEEDVAKFAPILDYISEVVGIPIRQIVVMDFSATLQAMMFGHADMARIGPVEYIQARDLFGAIALVRDIRSDTGEPFYHSLMIAHAKLGLDPDTWVVDDLKGLKLAFVSRTSTSGYMVPKTMMDKLGIAEEDFSEIYFAGSHAAVCVALAEGMVDLACVSEWRYLKALASDTLKAEDVTILIRSDPIPTGPTIVRPEMDPELMVALTGAWLTVPLELVATCKLDRFVPVLNRDYDPIREMMEVLGLGIE